jgi:hypothetical protein
MDLLIARNATRRSVEVIRAIARLFASSQLPDRIQSPNGQRLDEDDDGPVDILQFLEDQAAAGTLFKEHVESESSEAPTELPSARSTARHLTQHTISSVHIRTIRAYAETAAEHDLVRECDQALGPPMDPLIWVLDLRRRLAGYYNALFIDGVTFLGHWTGHAWRQVALASAQFFNYPDLLSPLDEDQGQVEVFDPVAEAQVRLRDLRPEDVPHEAQQDLHRVKTAKNYDFESLRAMGRLWSHALEWRLRRVEAELGRDAREDRDDDRRGLLRR